MIKAPKLDWNRIEAARANAHYLRSEAAHDIATRIGNAVRGLFQVGAPLKSGDTPLVKRWLEFAKARSPLEKGLQAGWY
jgi:hypothetical protein